VASWASGEPDRIDDVGTLANGTRVYQCWRCGRYVARAAEPAARPRYMDERDMAALLAAAGGVAYL
jgi:hypothetical protein